MRRPRPWIRGGSGMFSVKVKVGGVWKVFSLGVPGPDLPENRARAEAALDEWLAARSNPGPHGNVATPLPLLSAAVADYLAYSELRQRAGKLSGAALSNYRNALGPIALQFGSTPVHQLGSPEGRLCVEAWCAERGWSPSYQHSVLSVLQAALRRAGMAVKFDRPPMESRGPDVCLTDEQFALVLANLFRKRAGDLAALLSLLRETGRRPQEAARLTVESIDWANCCKLAREHKTKRKTGRDALWVFNSAAMAILERQRQHHRTGLLFRTSKGTAYGRRVIANQLLAVSRRVGFRVIAYGLGRHSFANKALEAGIPDVMVAALLGHSSTTMVHKHYSHVNANARAMRAAAERVSGK